jgi:DNA polymerase III delta subunit
VSDEKPLLPLYLIGGTDRPKVRRIVHRLVARMEGEGGEVERHEVAGDAEFGPADAVGACNALGLFAARRLVLVEGCDGWRADDIARHLEPYAKEPAPDTVLALVFDGAVRKDSRLRKLVPEAGQLIHDPPPIGKLVHDLSRLHGVRLEPDAARRLVDLVGERPEQLDAELHKLATWADGEEVDERVVDALVFDFDARDRPPWTLLDHFSRRDRRATFEELERLYGIGRAPASLVPLIAGRLAYLRRLNQAHERREPAAAVAADTGRRPFFVQKELAEWGPLWPERDTARAAALLADADHDSKGGSRLDPEHVLERTLAAIL